MATTLGGASVQGSRSRFHGLHCAATTTMPKPGVHLRRGENEGKEGMATTLGASAQGPEAEPMGFRGQCSAREQ